MIRALFALGLLLAPLTAQAQQAAIPQQPGYLTITGCPSTALTPCFIAFSPATAAHVISGASTNSTSVKASSGSLYELLATNTNATTAYVKLYDKATAPTCNSDTVLHTLPVPQNNTVQVVPPFGMAFTNGIGLCITGGIADNDNSNATTGITVNVLYR